MFRVKRVKVKRALSRSSLPDLDYALNPYIGCSHGCIYCYARLYTWINEASHNWGRVVFVKENLVDVLREEVKRYRPGVVGVSTITDPYQPVEAVYGLTRRSIELLLRNGFHVSIQTKNTLVLRDLDLLEEYRSRVDVGFTITSLDNNGRASLLEPNSSPSTMRAHALERIAERGVDTWIFYGPVIPGFNDDSETVVKILSLARRTGSRVLIDYLHVKPFMKEPGHPLNRFIGFDLKSWWRGFIEETMARCRDYGVECIEGYYEPVGKTTIEKFLAKS